MAKPAAYPKQITEWLHGMVDNWMEEKGFFIFHVLLMTK